MGNYPPPPPGGGYPPAPAAGAAWDPNAYERALGEWASSRGFTYNATPDVRWYQGWAPFVYLFPISRVGREVRATFGEASVWIIETFEGDAFKQATGEDRHLCGFVTSPRLAYRSAVRSRLGGGMVDDIGKELNSLFSSTPKAGGALGDPNFESRYEVTVPTREEGNAALPIGLRQLLLQSSFKGIIEARAGGLACCFYDRPGFDPQSLDGTLALLGQIYRTASQYAHPVTAPP